MKKLRHCHHMYCHAECVMPQYSRQSLILSLQFWSNVSSPAFFHLWTFHGNPFSIPACSVDPYSVPCARLIVGGFERTISFTAAARHSLSHTGKTILHAAVGQLNRRAA